MQWNDRRWWVAFGAGVFVGAAASWPWAPPRAVAQGPAKPAADVAALAAEIEKLKGKLPDQAHAMEDVGRHFANLWFAGGAEHWPLAEFYWAETRSHLRWAVRIIPVRKDASGREIDLQAILQAVENSPLKELEASVKAKDKPRFENAYRATVEACYACHKAADKPFLRPLVPTSPGGPIINFDPKAEWPR